MTEHAERPLAAETHTTDELRFLRRCAEACSDWAEAARITAVLAERRDDTGPALKAASDRSRPRPTTWARADKAGRPNGARLTRSAVGAIRRSYGEGESARTLARAFGTSEGNVYAIVRGETWREGA